MSVLIGIVLLIVIVAIIVYLFPLAKVSGCSMYPTLKDGQIVLCSRLPVLFKKFADNNIYVYHSPMDKNKLVVKRLAYQSELGLLFLGDNPNESLDSRFYGGVNAENIVAKVIIYKHN